MHRKQPRQRSQPVRKQRLHPWRWLGLGTVVLAITALLRGERRSSPPPLDRASVEPANDLEAPLFEPPADVTASWIPGPSGSIRVLERFPSGTVPIVFVHGLGGRAEQWAAQFAAVGLGIRAVAIDLPAHGQSDPTEDDDYSVPRLAATIAAVVDSSRLRRFTLVGHGLGAAAAVHYASLHSNRVAGLLLVDPSGDQTRLPQTQHETVLNQLRRAPHDEVSWHFKQLLVGAQPEVAERVLEELKTIAPRVLVAAFESAMRHTPLDDLAKYDGPVHSVVSDFNTLPNSLHRSHPDVSFSHVRGASHWLMMDHPDELWEILVDFLDRLVDLGRLGPSQASSDRTTSTDSFGGTVLDSL